MNDFKTVLHWKREDLLGYISTWSAIQKYIKVNGHSPVSMVEEEIKKRWPEDQIKTIVFPIYLKLGIIKK